jgi:hypothetical protein
MEASSFRPLTRFGTLNVRATKRLLESSDLHSLLHLQLVSWWSSIFILPEGPVLSFLVFEFIFLL